jgi:hypothetical protein
MYVTRDKSDAIVFVFSVNSQHWNNLVPRLPLRGLLPDAVYEVTEPNPNDITQVAGTFFMIETDGKLSFLCFFCSYPLLKAPAYQLGVSSALLTGDILMSGGLPIRFYTLDDAVVFYLKRVNQM